MKMIGHLEVPYLVFTIALKSLSDGPLSDAPVGGYRDDDLGRLLSWSTLFLDPLDVPHRSCVLTWCMAVKWKID